MISWTNALKPAAKSSHFITSPSKGSRRSRGELVVWDRIALGIVSSIQRSEVGSLDCFVWCVAIRSESVRIGTSGELRLLQEFRCSLPTPALLVLPASTWNLLLFTGLPLKLVDLIVTSSYSRAANDYISLCRSNFSVSDHRLLRLLQFQFRFLKAFRSLSQP